MLKKLRITHPPAGCPIPLSLHKANRFKSEIFFTDLPRRLDLGGVEALQEWSGGGGGFAGSRVLMSPQPSALVQSVGWVEHLLLGPFAVSLAVIAVAFTGLAMLRGRVPVEAIFRLAMGCFIVFSAPAIAEGVIATMQAIATPKAVATPEAVELSRPRADVDPYAGATAPVR